MVRIKKEPNVCFIIIERLTLHEPPRRVLVSLPDSRVTLSDYLFPGEGPSEALMSLQELLDLQVEESDVQTDLEVQAGSYLGAYYEMSPTTIQTCFHLKKGKFRGISRSFHDFNFTHWCCHSVLYLKITWELNILPHL
jgi:hypothetical protein